MRFRDMCIDLWAPWLTRPRGELRTHTLVGHDKQYVCSSIGVQTYSSRELSQSGACGSNDLLVGYVDINLARCGLRNLRHTTQNSCRCFVCPWDERRTLSYCCHARTLFLWSVLKVHLVFVYRTWDPTRCVLWRDVHRPDFAGLRFVWIGVVLFFVQKRHVRWGIYL